MKKHVTCHIEYATKNLSEENRAALNHHRAESPSSQKTKWFSSGTKSVPLAMNLTCEYASTSLLWRRLGAPLHAAMPKNNSTSGATFQQANSNRELHHLQRNPNFLDRVESVSHHSRNSCPHEGVALCHLQQISQPGVEEQILVRITIES